MIKPKVKDLGFTKVKGHIRHEFELIHPDSERAFKVHHVHQGEKPFDLSDEVAVMELWKQALDREAIGLRGQERLELERRKPKND